ncbi:hypothetical protein [Flavobacterium sp. A45]|uniref:hypothetical protein n=1 Tax=Flavobacterium sp. A45 TaxID=1945862 RepID=UPI0009864711|nr:hypothetical protein [Flavobacterium sp. A45]OOG77316.1 hypothetical protein B0E44_02900 [Flavobacterium sp. A45]
MKKKLTLLILLTIIVVGFCIFRKQISYEIYRKINIISAGSYPYAETYYLNYSESEVKNAIKKFKELHPEYKVPKNIGEYELIDHQTKNPAFWYVTFFYFQDENEVIQTWIRNNGKSETTFAFVQVNQVRINSWENINDDFNYNDNSKQIEKFEKRILKVLIEILKANKGGR